MSDYNYFNVEDFSVDSFFRSLELQSRFASNDLEFSFPTDLENVPISSGLTSVGLLDSTTAKSTDVASGLSAVDESFGYNSHLTMTQDVTETLSADDNDDDNAIAVDNFFRSLQLRSCLLRANDDITVRSLSHCSRDGTVVSDNVGGLFTHSQHVGVSDASSSDAKHDQTLSRDVRDQNICHDHQGSVYLPEKSTNCDYLSPAWPCSSVSEGKGHHCTVQQSSSTQSQTVDELMSSTHAQVAHNSYSRAKYSQLCRPVSSAKQGGTATTKADSADDSEGSVSKGGKMSCDVCHIELSSKYSFVRHLLTPLHCRRAEGYCTSSPPLVVTDTSTQDVVHLISRQKPVQCRVCRFYGDTSSQLLYHLTSTSHCSRVKRKVLRCLPCRFVGTCDDIMAHVQSEPHVTLVKQNSRPSVITAYRSRQHQQHVVRDRTKDQKCCSYCNVKFPSASSLEIHIRRRHTGQRPFACCVCDKSYCDNSTLRLHYRTAQHGNRCAQRS